MRTRQVCSFRLDRLLFAVPVDPVQEVVRGHKLTAVPLAPACLAGLINLRGQVVTVFDLRIRLGLPPRPPDRAGVHVIIRSADGAVSLLADEIGDVIDLDEKAFEPPPETLQGDARELISGAYKLEGRLLLALDLDRTLSFTAPSSSSAGGRTG